MRPLPRQLRRIALGAVVPGAILLVWHVASRDSVVVPAIADVLDVLAHPWREPRGLDSPPLVFGATLSVLRVACGLGLAALTGVPLGLWMGRCRSVREVLAPTVAAAMAVSPIAWLPVTIIVFGLASPATVMYGQNAWQHLILDELRFAVVAVIWMGAFFPIVLNTAAGVAGVRTVHVEVALVARASKWQVLRKIILPSAAPAIVTGLRVGTGIAWRVIVAAEIFPGTRGGLGYMIATAHEVVAYEYAFAAIVVIAAIGLGLDGLLRLAATRVGRWQERER